MRGVLSQTHLLILFFFLSPQLRAEQLLCKNLFHVTIYDEGALQSLAQQALAVSEQLANTPPSFLSISERLLRRELKREHKKMLTLRPPPPSHPGALFVQSYYTPEFYWRTTVSTRSGALQMKALFLTQAQREELQFIWSENGVVHVASGEKMSDAISGDFVIGLDLQIYIAYTSSVRPGFFRHSSFFAGGPVLFAGHIEIQPNGMISHVSRNSGHYRPSRAHLLWAIDFLSSAGFTVADSYPDFFK
jgi:hypothetical protein